MATPKASPDKTPQGSESVKPDQVTPSGVQTGSTAETATETPNKGVSVWRPDFDVALPAEIEAFIAGTRPDDQGRDPEAVSMEIMLRILQATNVDDVFAGTQLVHAGEILNTPVTVWEVKWNKSDFAEGPGVYCVVTGWDHIMQHEVTVSCGGINAIAQLYMLNKFGALPMTIEFQESPRPTASGYRPLWLKPRPDVPIRERGVAAD